MAFWQKFIKTNFIKRTEPKVISSPLLPSTKHLLVEFPPSHEFLFDVFCAVPHTQQLSVYAKEWWITEEEFSSIRVSPQIRLVFFLTLDRLLYNPNLKNFTNFAKRARVPMGGIFHRLPNNDSDMEALHRAKHLVSYVIVLTEQLLPDIRKLFGDEISVFHLSHPVSKELLAQTGEDDRASIGAGPDDFVVSMLGEARQGKGFELLFEAFKFIPKDERARLFFLFGGKGTIWSAEAIQEQLDRNDCRGYVDIRNSKTPRAYRLVSERELANYVKVSDLALLLYQDEQRRCASGVAPNYVWARKPILATKESYIGSDILKHDLGCVLEEETPKELARLLGGHLSSKPWKPSDEYEHFRASLSNESVIFRLQKILEECAENRARL